MAEKTPAERAYAARAAERARSAHLSSFSPASERRAAAFRKAFGAQTSAASQLPARAVLQREPSRAARGAPVPGLRPERTPGTLPARSAPARAPRPTDRELERGGVSTSSPMLGTARPSKPAETEYGRASLAAAGKPVPGVSKRPTKGEPVPEWMKRRAEAFNKANRVELSAEQFAGLSLPQQEQVRLNTALTQAYDADLAGGDFEARAVTKSLFDEAGIKGKPGLGLGPVALLGELKGTGPNPIAKATGDRQKRVNELAGKLTSFVQKQNAAIGADVPAFDFDNEQTRTDVENGFEFMLDERGRSSMSWRDAKKSFESIGINADDFKTYALQRLSTIPAGEIDLPAINAWLSED